MKSAIVYLLVCLVLIGFIINLRGETLGQRDITEPLAIPVPKHMKTIMNPVSVERNGRHFLEWPVGMIPYPYHFVRLEWVDGKWTCIVGC
jgi:hypothetical protein